MHTQGQAHGDQRPECAMLLAWPPGTQTYMPRAVCDPAEPGGGSWAEIRTRTDGEGRSRSSGGTLCGTAQGPLVETSLWFTLRAQL